jgi:hypothetical protein
MNNLQIAETILNQLNTNPNKIKAMVGGQCLAIENGLQINFKGNRKMDRVQITLRNDLYDVKFFKLNKRTFDCPMVLKYDQLPAEKLKAVLYVAMGLDLHL